MISPDPLAVSLDPLVVSLSNHPRLGKGIQRPSFDHRYDCKATRNPLVVSLSNHPRLGRGPNAPPSTDRAGLCFTGPVLRAVLGLPLWQP